MKNVLFFYSGALVPFWYFLVVTDPVGLGR